MSESHTHKTGLAALTVGALGVVFGDIGTSPLYTLKECFHSAGGRGVSQADLYGVLSLIFWALMMVVTLKYLVFILRANNNGEGGIFSLLALVPERLRAASAGQISLVAVLAVIGASLLYGDGAITPAISVLSAVEGLTLVEPSWSRFVVPLSCLILVGLFALQSRGTGTVGKLFGPVMLLWFGTLGALGLYHIVSNPEILLAASPHHAWGYFARHGWPGIHILASVVLAVTGGEALYADMGHFGVKPIRVAWLGFVLPSLVLNYFGQGAHALRNPDSIANPFFSLVSGGGPTIALLLLSSSAAVIASQALISGAFSLTRQAMQLGFFPRVRVLHTAHQVEGQIYVPEINALLGFASIMLVLTFRESSRLAAAYGIANAGTMMITSVMYFLVIRKAWSMPLARATGILLLFLSFDIPFVVANLGKLLDGGYVPILLGSAMATVMVVWNRGRTLLAQRALDLFPSREEAVKIVQAKIAARVPGTAVFMTSNSDALPTALVRHVERSRSLHQTIILLTVRTAGRPSVPTSERWTVTELQPELHRIVLQFGFMEEPMVVPCLQAAAESAGIPFPADDVTYYLGRDNLLASSKGRMGAAAESVFSYLQKNSVAADRFFGLPPQQVVELGTQVDL